MKDKSAVFQLLGETTASIFPLAQTIMPSLFEEYFTEQRFYQAIFMAYNNKPDAISADLFSKRNPYANPASVKELLEGAAEDDYLKPDGLGGYIIAERGSTAIEAVHETFYNHVNKINEFPDDQLNELAALLKQLVDSVQQVDFDDGKICFDLSYHGHIKVDSGTLAQVDQLLDDLNAFRDDAHISAWKPVGVDGHTWEVLTLIWNGEANTVEKLVERLPYRQHEAGEYQETLGDLAQRGWIDEGPEGYLVTKEGKKIRDDAEDVTNSNYFKPWGALTEEEINRLGDLLSELKETNLKLAEELNAE